jgi:nitronate monooxygenase
MNPLRGTILGLSSKNSEGYNYMLKTFLTEKWGLTYPIVNAPMAGIAHSNLVRAVSQAGGLGMLGIGRDKAEFVEQEVSNIRSVDKDIKFGIGLILWAVERDPPVFEAVLAAKPFLISLHAGDYKKYIERIHANGSLLAVQVASRDEAVAAEQAGVDVIVVQGTEAGGHTNKVVGTLPLLQVVLDSVTVPVLAAGGVAGAKGLAAVLAAGAEGIWSGTAFLACPETNATDSARQKVIAAKETDTVLTYAFDKALNLPWSAEFPGRALKNEFTAKWHNRIDELVNTPQASEDLKQALRDKNYAIANIYAGEAVGQVNKVRAAAEVIREIGEGAEVLLRERFNRLL